VGVCTRPSDTAPSNAARSRIEAARVAFIPTGAGTYELVSQSPTVTALKGIVAPPTEPVSVGQMEDAVSAAAAKSIDQ
jgi:hypothetical protein